MRASERLTITLPAETARQLREAVSTSEAGSVSAFLRQLVEDKLEEENLDVFLAEMEARGGPSTDASRGWAQKVADAVHAEERGNEVA